MRCAHKLEAVRSVEEGASVTWIPVLLCRGAGLWPEDACVSQPLQMRLEEVLCTAGMPPLVDSMRGKVGRKPH